MQYYIDAYDWVMVENVYGMSHSLVTADRSRPSPTVTEKYFILYKFLLSHKIHNFLVNSR